MGHNIAGISKSKPISVAECPKAQGHSSTAPFN